MPLSKNTYPTSSPSLCPVPSNILPKLSILVSYPLLLTSVRVTCFNHLNYDASGRRLRYYSASFRHGYDLVNRYGVMAIYRGVEVYLAHNILRHQIRPLVKQVTKKKRVAIALRYAGEIVIYPLTLACTRIVAHTTGDSGDWSAFQVWQDTVKADGWLGLWSGVAPFLLAQVYDDLSDLAVKKMRRTFPDLDATDEAVARVCLAAHGAVATAPLLTISTLMRCQSNIKSLPAPQGFMELVKQVDWRSTGLQLALVTGLCAINCKFFPRCAANHYYIF